MLCSCARRFFGNLNVSMMPLQTTDVKDICEDSGDGAGADVFIPSGRIR